MLTLVTISLIIALVYIGAMLHLFGVTGSISETCYCLSTLGPMKKLGGLSPSMFFSLFCFGVAATLVVPWTSIAEGYEFCSVFACGGLAFIGAAPFFKQDLEGKVHYISAAILGILSQIWVIFGAGLWYISIPLVIGAFLIAKKHRNLMYWVEIAIMVSTYIAIYVKYIF